MINPELLEILRCPLNPSKARLVVDGADLICERCVLRFKVRDGFPILVVEEAVLPAGCESVGDLPCQREASARDGASAASAH